MKLSVIICVYNTDYGYLEKCLSSITSSTLSDYEIVFVDDGSTVDYTEILAKYKVKYSKTENRGHLAARLHGIEISEGEYITFVDSDDTVSENYHLPMLLAAEREGADIVLNSWAFHTDRTRRAPLSEVNMKKSLSLSGDEIMSFFAKSQGKDHSVFVQWNKIFRREVILSAVAQLSSFRKSEKRLTYAEDVLLSFFCYKNSKKIINIHSGFYFYRIHSAQSVSVGNEEKLKSQIECMSEVFDIMLENLSECEGYGEIKKDIFLWRELMSRTHYSSARYGGYDSLFPFIKEKYAIEKLSLPRLSDSSEYSKSELLGDNFDEIDKALTRVFLSEGDITVSYKKSSLAAGRIIDTLRRVTDKNIEYKKKGADIEIPAPKVKIRDRIIHNAFVYRVGMILFKKGSRARNFLKRHL